MKKLYIIFAFFTVLLNAQTKSSGLVNLGTRMKIQVEKNNTTNKAKITISGPSDRWFAVSFRDTGGSLIDQDCIITNSATALTGVKDATFPGGLAAYIDSTQNITVLSDSTVGTVRTIVVERGLTSTDGADYPFFYSDNSMELSWAVAPSATFSITSKHGNSSTTDRSFATINFTVLGNDTFDKLSDVSVYPNPSNGEFTLSNIKTKVQTVKVFDTKAQLIKTIELKSENTETKIDLSSLSKGVYFMEISNENNKVVKKVSIK